MPRTLRHSIRRFRSLRPFGPGKPPIGTMGGTISKTSSQRMSSANGATGETRMRHVSSRVRGLTMGEASRGTTDPAIYRATARAMTTREDPVRPRIGTRSCRPHKIGQVENMSEPGSKRSQPEHHGDDRPSKRRARSPPRPSYSLADSHRRAEGRIQLSRDWPEPGWHHGDHTGRDKRSPRRPAPLPPAHGEVRREHRQPTGKNSGTSGRPSAQQAQLNKRITCARDAEGILAIVEAEHGDFDAVNAATACNRLAKTRSGASHGPRRDDRRVQTLFSTITRVSAELGGKEVSNMVKKSRTRCGH